MRSVYASAIAVLLLSGSIHAQNSNSLNVIEFKGYSDTAPDSMWFPEIQSEARRLNKLVGDAILLPTRQSVGDGLSQDIFEDFGKLVRRKATEKLQDGNYDKLPEQLLYFEQVLADGESFPAILPVFEVVPNPKGPRATPSHFYFFTRQQENENRGGVNAADTKQISVTGINGITLQTNKVAALRLLEEAIYPYQRNANAFTAYQTRILLNDLANDWDAYFDDGRSQTFVDILATTLIEYSLFKKDHLVGPPPRQWFVLHPNVVIENVSDAPDGEQFKAAVSVEWLGVNWWDETPLIKVPFGISVSSLYSDRPGVEDVGHGITMCIDNKYSFGYANHDGDHGYFLSLDLLKLFEKKEQQVERYRTRIKGAMPQ